MQQNDSSFDATSFVRQLLLGFSGAFVFGIASVSGYWVSGARMEIMQQALSDATGVASAMLAINALGFPALAILLTLSGSDYNWYRGLRGFAEATQASGGILLGLTPVIALYSLTLSGHNIALGLLSLFGVLAASLVSMRRALPEFVEVNVKGTPVVLGFAAFVLALGVRFAGRFLIHAFSTAI